MTTGADVSDIRTIRCPATGCATLFPIEARRLGRNVYCPACGGRLTARPPSIDDRLAQRAAAVPARDERSGAAIARLPLTVIVDNVRSLWNVGSIFRSADAFGVERIVLCGITGCPPRPEIAKTALGAERAVAWSYRADLATALEEQRRGGTTLYALERTEAAEPIDRCDWSGGSVALVVGNEVAGVGTAALETDVRPVAIPMQGVKESLNVAVAFGIAAHAASAALRARGRGVAA